MYDIDEYGEMVADRVRTDAYEAALRASIVPGRSVVVDLGCGTGILAALACRLGAKRVYAIEPDDAIEVAREIAQANGFANRIEFYQGLSHAVQLPERADVVVSDLHGALPVFPGHFDAVIDARKRFLSPEGILIPRSESLWFAVAEAPELHQPVTVPWGERPYGLDLLPGAKLAANVRCRARFRRDQLLTDPVRWAELDYATLDAIDCTGAGEARAVRDGLGHGLCVWFDSVLAPGIGFSNAPGGVALVYGTMFFRWPRAVEIRAGQRVAVQMRATYVGNDYVWAWETSILGAPAPGQPLESFRQSNFFARPVTSESLRRRAAGFAPQLSEDGDMDLMILQAMARGESIGDIAREVAARYPQRFPGLPAALARVADLSSKYAR